jgi:hypothetical protein
MHSSLFSTSLRRLATHRTYSSTLRNVKMASKLKIDSTIKLNSGYEIPVLGFGVGGPRKTM